MKRLWFMMLSILGIGCFLFVAKVRYQSNTAHVQTEMAQEVIRFHVRANSDSDEDQSIKMQVKKEVLSYLQPLLQQAENVQKTKVIIENSLDQIERTAEQTLLENGYSYGAAVSMDKEHFPQKTYGDCTFPAGEYLALVIELGEGDGHNWWCMIYPSLCFVNETYGIVSDEKKEELKGVLSEDAYEWIVDPNHRKITLRWTWLRKVLEFAV